MKKRYLFAVIALASSITVANAHVVLAEPAGAAGSYYRATFKVGHGCDGSSTTAIVITLPDGITAAKPMPKPGWTLKVKREKLAVPYTAHGKTITEDVREIAWRDGVLPDAHYDEFVVQIKLPDSPGKRYFKVIQTCETGAWEWVQIPETDKPGTSLRAPAPVLDVLPAKISGAGEHKH